MADEQIIKRVRRDFPGINRSVSANDNPDGAAISRDGRHLPTGRFVRRPEYDNLYDYREQQFEHTTDDDATTNGRTVRTIAVTHAIYRSHGRKLIALGASGSTEYEFTLFQEVRDTAGVHTLWLDRSQRTTGLDGTWPVNASETEAGGGNGALAIVSVGAGGIDLLDWIEASMVMNTAKDTLYIIATIHDEGAGTTVINLYKVTTANGLYGAFIANATVTLDTNVVLTDTNLTRDIDIELAVKNGSDCLCAIWGISSGVNTIIKYAVWNVGVWGAVGSYVAEGALNIHSCSIVKGVSDPSYLYMSYTITDGTRRVHYNRATFTASSMTFNGTTVTLTGVSILTGGTNFYYSAILCIDSDDVRHWVYLGTDQKLYHIYATGTYLVETFSTPVALTGVIDFALTATQITGWDFIVKNGEVCIFYVDDSYNYRIYKATRIITSGDVESGIYNRSDYTDSWQYDLIEQVATTRGYKFLSCYRKYETNTSKRLSYVTSLVATDLSCIVKFLHSDKGLYSVSDTNHALQVYPVWLEEPLMPKVNGTAEQVLIMQASDNCLYKRVNYEWMLLEGFRKIDNSGWQIVTVFDDHMRVLQYGGILRILVGSSSSARNLVYQYIDRYFFNNDAANRYVGYHSDYQRMVPPIAANLVSVTTVTHANAVDPTGTKWIPFATYDGALSKSKVTNTYVMMGDSLASYKSFFGAISFEYDGVEESQLYVQASNDAVFAGITLINIDGHSEAVGKWIKFSLSLTTWDSIVAARTNQRLTAVNLYLGEVLDVRIDKTKVQYYKVKRVQVSNTKPTGNNAFADDNYLGTGLWTVAGGTATPTVVDLGYVDFSMWESREARGTAEQNLGTSLVRYTSTGSGTELYTKETMIPEAYKFGLVLQNEIWAAQVRLAGVTRKNRLMRSARAHGTIVTPDAFNDDISTNYDFSYDIQGIAAIDDNTLVVKGTHGTDVFDVTGGVLRKRDDISKVGTTRPDMVVSIAEGAVGEMIKGVLSQDPLGNIRLFDGYGEGIVSDAVREDFDSSNRGVAYLVANAKQILYVPLYRLLMMSFGTQIFVLDLAGGKDWQDWRFTYALNAGCVGVDGEMFFTDNLKVYVFPQAGSVDNPDPIWRELDVGNKSDERLIPKNVWMDYILTTSESCALQPKVWKDRALTGNQTNSTNTLAASTTQIRRRTGYVRTGSNAMRETAIGFGVTTASTLTTLEVDSIEQEFLVMKKRP